MSLFFSGALSILIMLLILGVLITVHELGHFLMARLCGISVREFSIGMGPTFYKRQKKNRDGQPEGTLFSLRALPIGGFCDMGEDEASDDPNHFRNKKSWQKALVLLAGSAMNFLIGIVIFIAAYLCILGFFQPTPVIGDLTEGFPYGQSIQPGDRVVAVNGHVIFNYTDLLLYLDRDSGAPYEFTLERDGKRLAVSGIERTVDNGQGGKIVGFTPRYEEITLPVALREAAASSVDTVRIVWLSLGDLFSGRAGVTDMMGPVAMGGAVNDIVTETQKPLRERAYSVLYLAGLIAVNLAVVNLLPIPALDGGRILFLLFSWFLVKVRKRALSPKVEGYIHGVTMLLLFGLMIFIFFNDIRRLVGL